MKYSLTGFFLIILLGLLFAAPAAADEVYRWNFKPAENNQPSDTEEVYKELLKKYNGYFIGDTDNKELYLTFDNGYENGYTSDILDVLKEKDVPAAFFVTGHYLKSAPDLVKRMKKEGHIVGNHSYHHPSLPEVSNERIEKELDKVKEAYTRLTGDDDMLYLRPPQGTFSERSLKQSQQLGYINVFWSFAYVDWETEGQKGPEHAYQRIMKRVHPGAVMLLHAVSEDNAKALEKVIDECQEQGYTFKSLDELVLKTP
ncbi:peptidoglycan-N-acetylmuramic acid deacetylase [Alteribacillus persepolensis]|uniref:Peptidoglycan-N-acetylmuramic acid deacetylase n=1 Tax=Alteribacillus persepolensis TaxID=568899 RepID=A0A1G8CBK0_9BACI|nr:delta-lactam-biosynthetic de-N-acetylase [Alteribacillus persepolensis]SDH42782.1 peptidoglycan-N-acetylmuramic acid deacetylase [Alteribacillus persepolensis]